MHMADALISPGVGAVMGAASAGLIGYSSRQVARYAEERKIPLMGVLGAFIFAAQMINFTIPATGSSGHLGGGMILSILLGPEAAFLVMASILTVQALFFGDGGLLALGCNIFNMGFFPCFIAYPLIYRRITGDRISRKKIVVASLVSSVIALQLGAVSVVLETMGSGISELPFKTFLLLMQPIHLAIGIVEGMATAAVVLFVWQARPEVLQLTFSPLKPRPAKELKKVIAGFLALTLLTGGVLCWFASRNPDGLEWALSRTGIKDEHSRDFWHAALAAFQEKTAVFPDYGFKENTAAVPSTVSPALWPDVEAGTSVSGLIGSAATFLCVMMIGWILRAGRGYRSCHG